MVEKLKAVTSLPPKRLLLVAILVNFSGSFHYGCQLSLTSPLQTAFINFLNHSIKDHYGLEITLPGLETIWSNVVAVYFLGAIFGTILLCQVADKIGRKRGLICVSVASTIFLLLEAFSKFANSFELYTIFRFAIGVTFVLSTGLGNVFLVECSPKCCRGAVNVLTSLMLSVGSLTFAAGSAALPQLFGGSNDQSWWLIYVAEAAMSAIVLLFMPFIHDSPEFLFSRGDDIKAKKAIQFYHDCSSETALDVGFLNMRENMGNCHNSLGMLEVWHKRDGMARRGAIFATVLGVIVTFTGIGVIDAFAVDILLYTKISLALASMTFTVMMLATLVGCLCSVFIIDRMGRRPLLLGSLFAIFVLNTAIGASLIIFQHLEIKWIGFILMILMNLYSFVFGIGIGPLYAFLSAEIVAQDSRAAVISWTNLCFGLSRAISIAMFLPLRNAISNGIAYNILFSVPLLFAIILFYYTLPESMNRDTLEIKEAIQELPKWPFTKRKSGRK